MISTLSPLSFSIVLLSGREAAVDPREAFDGTLSTPCAFFIRVLVRSRGKAVGSLDKEVGARDKVVGSRGNVVGSRGNVVGSPVIEESSKDGNGEVIEGFGVDVDGREVIG